MRFSARRVASRRVMLFIGMTRCRPARGETARGPDAIDRPPLRTFALRRRGFEPRPVRVFLSYVLFRGRFGSTRSDIGRADDDTCSGTGTGTLQVRRDRRDSERGARRGFPTRIFPRARPPWPRAAAASARARRPTPRRRPRLQSPRRGPNGGGTRACSSFPSTAAPPPRRPWSSDGSRRTSIARGTASTSFTSSRPRAGDAKTRRQRCGDAA